MSRANVRYFVQVLLLAVAPGLGAQTTTTAVYWTSSAGVPGIYQADADDVIPVTFTNVLTNGSIDPEGIAIDAVGGKFYWADENLGKIRRANLDGTSPQDVISVSEDLFGLALDLDAQRVYWSEATGGRIRSADLDGTNQAVVRTNVDGPQGIDLDVDAGKVYWAAFVGCECIQRANMDGSGVVETIVSGLDRPLDVALDLSADKLYWSEFGTGEIKRVDKNGGTPEVVIGGLSGPPLGIALDLEARNVYWADNVNNRIRRVNIDSVTGIEEFAVSTDSPFGVAILQVPPTIVSLDIKPGSDPNCFNIDGNGVIPVAILGDAGFDVTSVDASSLLFDGLEVRVRGKRGPLCSIEDTNADGFMDMVCHFEDDASNWTGGASTGTLAGVLLDGTPIEGTDSICIVP